MGRSKMGGLTKSGKIKKKDPNRPKRPTSAYFFYAARMREEAARKGQSITRVAEWTKEISGHWRALTTSERAPFDKMAATDKQRYDAAMKIYKGKDEDKPKKPMSSYFMFLAEFRKTNKDKLDHKEVLRKAGEVWRGMTDTDKVPFEKLASIEKQKYDVAMKEYHAKKAAGPAPTVVRPPAAEAGNGEADDDDDEEYDDEEDDE